MRWAVAGGTLLPLRVAEALRWGYPDIPSVDEHKRLLQAWFVLAGAMVFYWTMVATIAAGCWIVRIMKGPVRKGRDPSPCRRRTGSRCDDDGGGRTPPGGHKKPRRIAGLDGFPDGGYGWTRTTDPSIMSAVL